LATVVCTHKKASASNMKLFALVFLTALFRTEAACPCIPTPANPKQTAAPGKPDYVGIVDAWGWECHAHDEGQGECETADDTAEGEARDWCLHKWCIVDKDNCDFKPRELTFTETADDYFSYEACADNILNFSGNGWIGRCKNCGDDYNTSFCTCGGLNCCPCLQGSTQQEAAAGQPAFVGEVASYGYGCMTHDKGKDVCATAEDTADGEPHDWCLDQWCIVDKDNCDMKTFPVTYTAATDDHFAYATCNADFVGNGWVGRDAEFACSGDDYGDIGGACSAHEFFSNVVLQVISALFLTFRA